jgi:hypothetical protein
MSLTHLTVLMLLTIEKVGGTLLLTGMSCVVKLEFPQESFAVKVLVTILLQFEVPFVDVTVIVAWRDLSQLSVTVTVDCLPGWFNWL